MQRLTVAELCALVDEHHYALKSSRVTRSCVVRGRCCNG